MLNSDAACSLLSTSFVFEQRRGVLAAVEHERGRQHDRHRARAGGGVGGRAGVQREGVEAGV
jgi:hypothetical protein